MPAPIDGLQPKRHSSAASEVASMRNSSSGANSNLPKAATRPLFAPNSKPAKRRRSKKPMLIIILILVLGAGAVYAYTKLQSRTAEAPATPVAEQPKTKAELTKTLGVAVQAIKLTGSVPQGLDIDPVTGYVFVANNGTAPAACKAPASLAGGNTLSAVDPAQNKELYKVATETAPVWTQVDGGRKVAYVSGSGNGMIGIHNLASGQKTATIDVKGKPQAFGFNAGTLVASNTADASQTYYSLINPDTRRVVASYKVPEQPHGVAFNAADKVFYILGASGEVAVVDGVNGLVRETFSATGGGGTGSAHIVYSAKLKRLYVGDLRSDSQVSIYDLTSKKVIGRLRFTNQLAPAGGMQLDDDKGLLYTALPGANAVGVADAGTMKSLGLIKVGNCPYAVDLDLGRGLGFTTDQVDATLSVFKLDIVLKQLGR